MRASTVLSLVALVALAAAAGKKKEASLYDFFKGTWDIYVYKTEMAVAEMPEDLESIPYTFVERNGTKSILDGHFMTDEGKEPIKMFVKPPPHHTTHAARTLLLTHTRSVAFLSFFSTAA